MKHQKNITSMLLVILMLLTVIPITALAATNSNLSVDISDTENLKVGDTFTVTLSNREMYVSTFTGGLAFSTNMLTCKSITEESGYAALAIAAAASECSTVSEANSTGRIGFGFANTGEETYNAAEIVTVTFEVKAAGTISISGYEDSDGTDGVTIAEGSAELSKSFKAGSDSPSGGCYVATAVYGSYDCPEVWTLRRFRDETLAQTWYGRAFIRTYYAISPTLVKWFGDTDWFRNMWRGPLDRMVADLNTKGVPDTPYDDIDW